MQANRFAMIHCFSHSMFWIFFVLSFECSTFVQSNEAQTFDGTSSLETPAMPNTTANDPLSEKRAAARKAREEARAQWLKVYEEQAAKDAAEREEHEKILRTQAVTFGSIITLKHVETDKLLAGTNFKYFHRHSSGQHQIIAAALEDGYTHWRVLPKVTRMHHTSAPYRYWLVDLDLTTSNLSILTDRGL